jgi:hypothetical protein
MEKLAGAFDSVSLAGEEITKRRQGYDDFREQLSFGAKDYQFAAQDYLICTPEMAREMIKRWISLVPSKIV